MADSTRDNPWGLVYKIAQNTINKKFSSQLKDINNKLIINSAEIAKGLLSELFPIDDPTQDNHIHRSIRLKAEEKYESYNDLPFSEQEITDVILEQNPKKSPGFDSFTADIIQELHKTSPKLFTKLYNKSLELNCVPKEWKKSVVKVLPKPGKTDFTDAKAYRPISLLPIMGKISEKLIIQRIMYYLKTNNKLSANQYGFTAQTSTEDALHSLTNFIQKSYAQKGFALIIALDISGAFNYAWWPKIICQLKDKKCPKNLLMTTKSYFNERYAQIWYLNNKYSRELNVGCPQGSACGPHYWNIGFDDIFVLANNDSVVIDVFADDTIVKIFAKTTQEVETIANNIINSFLMLTKRNVFCLQKT